jgi:hypothetical protein
MEKMKKMAIATVTSPSFVPGTLVLIHSFLKRNSWFNGDIVIITEGLKPGQADLFRNFPNISFRNPGNNLLLCLASLCNALPAYCKRRKWFYSIEVFNLKGYDKVFFFDSDMLVVSDLFEIMMLPDDLMACSDLVAHAGKVRDRVSFVRKPISDFIGDGAFLGKSFNAGFIAIGGKYLNESTYEGLIRLVHKRVFENIRTHNTDQVVYNLYFDGLVSLLPVGYNFVLSKAIDLFATKRIKPGEEKILHYTGSYKPWKLSSKMDELMLDPYFAKCINDWHAEYQEVMSKIK